MVSKSAFTVAGLPGRHVDSSQFSSAQENKVPLDPEGKPLTPDWKLRGRAAMSMPLSQAWMTTRWIDSIRSGEVELGQRLRAYS